MYCNAQTSLNRDSSPPIIMSILILDLVIYFIYAKVCGAA